MPDARRLVRDWLCTFVADYHKNAHMRADMAQLIQTPVRTAADMSAVQPVYLSCMEVLLLACSAT